MIFVSGLNPRLRIQAETFDADATAERIMRRLGLVAGAACKVSVAQELAISMCGSNDRAIGSDTSRMTEGIFAPMGPLT
jgi:hypothetical protein